jgi:hypothetical protein
MPHGRFHGVVYLLPKRSSRDDDFVPSLEEIDGNRGEQPVQVRRFHLCKNPCGLACSLRREDHCPPIERVESLHLSDSLMRLFYV